MWQLHRVRSSTYALVLIVVLLVSKYHKLVLVRLQARLRPNSNEEESNNNINNLPVLAKAISPNEDFISTLFTLCTEAENGTKHGLGFIHSFGIRSRCVVVVTNPKHAMKILHTSTQRMTGGALSRATQSFIGPKSLFALEQFDWKYERLKTKQILIRAVNGNTRAMEEVCWKLVAKIKLDVKQQQPLKLDMHALFIRVHFAIIGKTILDEDFDFFQKPAGLASGEEIISAFEYLVEKMPYIPHKPEIMESEEWKCRSEDARRLCRKLVRAKFQVRSTANPLLVDLFDLLTPQNEFQIVEEVTDCVMQFFLAGFHTVAVEMSFCLFYLCQNPTWWNPVRAEVDEALFASHADGGGLNKILTAKLPVLNAVRMETLRLVPPSPLTSRVLDSELELADGLTLKPGTDVMIPIIYLHASEQSWGRNAAEFDPKRWLQGEPKPGSFLAFSTGPRNCVGEMLSKAESLTALAMLVHYFSFSIVPGSRQIPKWTGFGIRPFDSSQSRIAMNLHVTRRAKLRQVEYTMRRVSSTKKTADI